MPHSADRPRPAVHLLRALLLAAAGTPSITLAEYDPWALCPPLPESTVAQMPAETVEGADREEDAAQAIELTADEAVLQNQEKATFFGDVVAIRDDQRLSADQAEYDQTTDTVVVEGNVTYATPNVVFEGESAQVNMTANSGTITGVRYVVPEAHAFGSADELRFESQEYSVFRKATYSTCPPGNEDWQLRADQIELDRATNTGEAWDVTLALKGIPVMYIPYLNFPIEGRKTGLLAPSYASSERSGTEISVPFYWNIAPNRDATLTPRHISKRGTMALTEFRYLYPSSGGILTYDVLPNDDLYDGETRYFGAARHDSQLSPHWSASLDYREVSDPDYFRDIGSSLAGTSTTHLEQRLDLNYRRDLWAFRARAQDYQALVEGNEPYQRLPQLLLTRSPTRFPYQLNYDLGSEYVLFEHDTREPTAERLDLYPGISYPMEGAAWFITPRLAGRYTAYNLDEAGDEQQLTRAVPVTSLDSGLFFERDLQIGNTPLVQTLEPRLFYLHVPFRDQSDIPVFDTTEGTFSFDRLFRENRFIGPDRMSDANQVTAALTTRFLDQENGLELLRASIGQIYYFSDPEVTLPGTAPETGDTSDLAAELASQPNPYLRLIASSRWDPDESQTEESAFRVRYSPEERSEVNFAYRYREAGDEAHTDTLVLWPLARQWRFLGRWYYDQVADRSVETVLGLEYESCCWIARVAGRSNPIIHTDGAVESDRSIHFTLQLKGLGNFGRDFESILSDGILGYR